MVVYAIKYDMKVGEFEDEGIREGFVETFTDEIKFNERKSEIIMDISSYWTKYKNIKTYAGNISFVEKL